MRMWYSLAVALALLLPAGCNNSGSTVPFEMRLQVVFSSGLAAPMDLQAPPGDSRLFIAERPGRIRVAQGGVLQTTPFLDISTRVYTQGEAGLLSFAFDPQYSTNGFVYVHFVENIAPFGDIVVERYRVSSGNPNLLDVSSLQPVIRIPHPDDTNHYGGRVAFGPDGKLYLSTGDGGGGGNQYMHAQDATSHLGKLLRLDVSTPPYTIPPDNPIFQGAAQNENWAIGLRNPFRYAFDGAQLYIADVGQDQREEIDVVQANASGLNYGWNIMEGLRCFPNGGQCNTIGLTPPVYDYDHGGGRCAIIGGYVYRGAAIPELRGQYLFSDFCVGFVRSLSFSNGVATVQEATVNAGSFAVQSFGQDGAGELYILTGDGRVLRIAKQ